MSGLNLLSICLFLCYLPAPLVFLKMIIQYLNRKMNRPVISIVLLFFILPVMVSPVGGEKINKGNSINWMKQNEHPWFFEIPFL